MSLLKKPGFVVVTFVLMAFAAEARAEHVDWSSYIDPNPSKPVSSKPVSVVSDEAPAKAKSSGKASKRIAKKATSKRKVKARAKKGRRK